MKTCDYCGYEGTKKELENCCDEAEAGGFNNKHTWNLSANFHQTGRIFNDQGDEIVKVINPNDSQQKANAQLIAAAPELLEALLEFQRACRAYYKNHDKSTPGEFHHAQTRMAQAIAKAEGK